MIKNNALLKRQAIVLFNFWLKKQQNDKRVGDLSFEDFVEMCELIFKSGITDNAKTTQILRHPQVVGKPTFNQERKDK
jgi:hypothetical protein